MRIIGREGSYINARTYYDNSEIFRDRVIAKDGYVYEREAITRWILEKGTSPFTKQPLQLNDLQPDDSLQLLTEEYRHEIVPQQSEKVDRSSGCIESAKRIDSPVYAEALYCRRYDSLLAKVFNGSYFWHRRG